MMTGEMAAFGIAVGGTSLICYLMMTRLQDRRAKRGSRRPTAGAPSVGSAAIIAHWTAQAIRAIQGEAIAEEALMGEAAMAVAAAEAIDNSRVRPTRSVDPPKEKFLDSFQFAFRSVWNRSKRQFFFLHPVTIFNIDRAASPKGPPVLHDCLFLQRPERPRCPQRRQLCGGSAPQCQAALRLPRLQR
jgi:hypothetical protein